MEEDIVETRKEKKEIFSREAMRTEVQKRALKDKTFRQALLTNPEAVLERDYPQWFPHGKIPQGTTIRIIEEKQDALNLILSAPRAAKDFSEVDEESLTNVSGGGILSGIAKLRPQRRPPHLPPSGTGPTTANHTRCVDYNCTIDPYGPQ